MADDDDLARKHEHVLDELERSRLQLQQAAAALSTSKPMQKVEQIRHVSEALQKNWPVLLAAGGVLLVIARYKRGWFKAAFDLYLLARAVRAAVEQQQKQKRRIG